MAKLEVICSEGRNEIHMMGEEGISILGEFEISGANVIYHHLDTKIGYSVGVFYEDTLRCIRLEDCDPKGMTFKNKGRFIVYFIDGNPKYLFSVEKACVIDVE